MISVENRPCREQLRIAAVGPDDAEAIRALVGRCSPRTLRRRFRGGVRGVTRTTRLLMERAGDDVYAAWIAGACVGIANLAVDDSGSGDVAILVEDRCQRQGIGAALLEALVWRARELGLSSLTADVLAEDRFILALLARIGPTRTATTFAVCEVRVGLSAAPRAPAG